MAKFMSSHSLPAGAMKREQIEQMAQAAQKDPVVRPYRSFLNPTFALWKNIPLFAGSFPRFRFASVDGAAQRRVVETYPLE